ncbi:MAG: thioredoxin family protein [Chloroflexi bacterium]|nr:thioredoxin family protein [Chloroflexota bacterium]
MFETINQYSAVIAIPGFLVAMFALLPIRSWRKRIPLYSGVAIAGIMAILVLQPGDSTVASESEARSVIVSGRPVFVEFFSNTCAVCLASEPIVRGLEGEVSDEVQILKLNVQDPIASQLIRDYRAFITPTFLVIGRDGEVIWRQSGGLLKKGEALEALDAA